MLNASEFNAFRITVMTAQTGVTSATLTVAIAARSGWSAVHAFYSNPANQRRARITARLVGYGLATALLWTAWCLQHLGIALNDWADNIRDIEAYDRSVSRAIPSWDSDADPTGGDRQPDIIDQAAGTPLPQEAQEDASANTTTQEVIDYLAEAPAATQSAPATKTRGGQGNRKTTKTSTKATQSFSDDAPAKKNGQRQRDLSSKQQHRDLSSKNGDETDLSRQDDSAGEV